MKSLHRILFTFFPFVMVSPLAIADLTNISAKIELNNQELYDLTITSATASGKAGMIACSSDCLLTATDSDIGKLGTISIPKTNIFPYTAGQVARILTGKKITNINYKGREYYSVSFVLKDDNGSYLINSISGTLKPVLTKCDILEKTLFLKHSPQTASEIDGNSTSETVNVKCNKTASVTIIAVSAGSSAVPLTQGIRSLLKIDGKDGAVGITKKIATQTSFTLSSTLQKTGDITAGDYHASGIINITFD